MVILDLLDASVLAVLSGHVDVVTALCGTPDGRLLTAGGKLDATVKVWDRPQWENGHDFETGDYYSPELCRK